MTSVRRHAEYDTKISRYNDVLILPAVAEAHTIGAFGQKKRLHDYESHLEALIAQEVVPALEARGFRARLLTNRDIHDKKLVGSVMRLRADYNAIREELYAKSSWKEEEAFAISKNVGQAAAEIGRKMHADALLMLDYAGSSKTSGALALNIFVNAIGGRYQTDEGDRAAMIVGIIDAKNGDVLWTNMSSSVGSSLHLGSNALEKQQKIDAEKLSVLISSALNAINTGK